MMNHETQRLLFAAARGARMQTHYHDSKPTWRDTGIVYGHAVECGIPQRIHPEDTHLQYGPVSGALISMGIGVTPDNQDLHSIAHHIVVVEGRRRYLYIDDDHYRWACLFAAELAADEGM